MSAPVVVFAVGNRARGDDALGPHLGERLAERRIPGVELLELAQLQVEQALDLEHRSLAVFLDAAVDLDTSCRLAPVAPSPWPSPFTHALEPPALLATARQVLDGPLPRAVCLSLRGESFGLGEGLSEGGRKALEAAWPRLLDLLGAALQPPAGFGDQGPAPPPQSGSGAAK